MLFVLLLMVGAAAAQSSAETRYTLCGRELARAHYLYCYGVEPAHTGPVELKLPWSFEGFQEDVAVIPKLPERFAYRARRAAASRLKQQSQKLAESCCLQPCHVMELISQC